MLQNPLVPPAQSTRSRRSVVRGAAGAVGLLLLGNWRLASGAGEAATEAHLPQVAPVPGGIVRVSLGPSQERPRAWAGEVPLLVLGVPSSPTIAILMGAFIINGLTPGPFLFKERPDLVWTVIASFFTDDFVEVANHSWEWVRASNCS